MKFDVLQFKGISKGSDSKLFTIACIKLNIILKNQIGGTLAYYTYAAI